MRVTIFLFLTLFFYLPQTWADPSSDYPESSMERRKTGFGSIIGNDPQTDGLQVFGKTIGGSKKQEQESVKNPTSDYLWQATLDSVRSIPIAAIDSKLGLISTDWYETGKNIRSKFNISIMGDNVKVNGFKKIRTIDGWKDVREGVSQDSDKLLKKILSKAKELQSKN